MRARSVLRAAILAGLAAAFQVSLFPPWGWRWAAWVGVVPLLVALRIGRVRSAVLTGWLFGSAAALGLVVGWLRPALVDFFATSLATRIGLLMLVSQWGGGLALAAFGALTAQVTLTPAWRVPFVAAAWTAVEYGRGQLPYGMPWAPLGAALAPDSPAAQVADLGGVYAVSFVVMAVNAALAEALLALRASEARRRGAVAAVGVAIVILALACGYGWLRRASTREQMASAPSARVALVHAEVENDRREGAARAAAVVDDYLALSPAAGAVDLVVWPENAVNLLLADNPGVVAHIAAKAGATPYLVGAPRMVAGGRVRTLRTSALVIADGTLVASYDKRRLLPFAETMPSLRGDAVPTHDFVAGTTAAVLDVGRLRLGPLICYEAIFPELARATVQAGAELLVNLSNDSWFPAGAGPAQHAQLTALRAVELRRALLRVANRGVTMVVLPDGGTALATDGVTPGVEVVRVPLLGGQTVYARLGDAFAWLCVVAVALTVVDGARPRR